MGKTKEKPRSGTHSGTGQPAKRTSKAASRQQATAKVPVGRSRRGKGGKKAAKPGRPPSALAAIREAAQGESVPGIPDQGQIDEATAGLSGEDRARFEEVQQLLAGHLGSPAAARLWLVSPSPGFVGTPLDLVRQGRTGLLLEMLESQWGPSPTYA